MSYTIELAKKLGNILITLKVIFRKSKNGNCFAA